MTRVLFRLLTWPYLKRHAIRYLMVAFGIALAVGVYVSMYQANNALEQAFLAVTETLAGSAQLQVTGGEAGVPEGVLESARHTGCVEAATAVILQTVSTGLREEGGLAVLGVDLLEDRRFREYRMEGEDRSGPDDALVFFAQPDSVLVTRQFAARNRLASGAALPVWTGRVETTLRVRGLLEGTGAARAYGGNLAVMDLYAAQHVFGRRGYFDRVDVAVRQSTSVEACRTALAQRLGSHLKVEPPLSRGRRTEALSTTYKFLVQTSALLGMLVSMFLVHHASATAVAQREREIAIVRGLGGDEGSVQRMVLAESLALGALGGIAGVGIGVLAATRLSVGLAGLLELGYGLSLPLASAPMDWSHAAGTVLVAAVFCAVSAIAPARRAAAIAPIQLMEAPRWTLLVERPWPAWAALAAGSGAVALLWQIADRRPGVLFVTLPLMAIALGLSGRMLSALLFRALRSLFAAAWPMEGTLAIDSLARNSRRTRGTLMGLSATVATFVAISGLTAGYADSFGLWARQLANADFLIHSSANPAARGRMFPLTLGDRLRSVPEVAAVLPVRRLAAEVDGRPASVVGIDFALWKQYGGLAAPASPNSAIVSRNFANLSGRRVGGTVRIAAPDGNFDLRVQGVIDDFIDENGSVWLDWRLFTDRFHDDAVEMFAVRLKPGASRTSARRGLLRQIDPRAPALVLDGEELRGYLDRLVNRWRAISYIQVAAAVLIALVGIGSFLLVSIVERRRELALIVVLGATPRQLARCVLVEALGVASAGLMLGAPLGILLQFYLLFTLRHSINGFDVPWSIDPLLVAALFVAVPAAALLAAVAPLRSLNRMNLAREVESDA